MIHIFASACSSPRKRLLVNRIWLKFDLLPGMYHTAPTTYHILPNWAAAERKNITIHALADWFFLRFIHMLTCWELINTS